MAKEAVTKKTRALHLGISDLEDLHIVSDGCGPCR